MPKKDTGLSGFADVQEEVAKERVAKTHVRTKGAGKVRHSHNCGFTTKKIGNGRICSHWTRG
jgi:hypothetical protein